MQDFNLLVNEVSEFIEKYDLIPRGKIAIALSGGKDSTLLAYVLKKLYPRRLYAITFNNHVPNFKFQLENIRKLTKNLNIDLSVISLKELTGYTLHELYLKNKKKLNHCHICGVLRRYYLNKFARENGFSALATGHNRDDIVQAFFMNLLRNKPELIARLGPVSGVLKDKRFVRKIKPFYKISEERIKTLVRKMNIPIYDFQCAYSFSSYRFNLKKLLWDYEEEAPGFHDKVVELILNLLPNLKLRYQSEAISRCKVCGEPSSTEVCNACRILGRKD